MTQVICRERSADAGFTLIELLITLTLLSLLTLTLFGSIHYGTRIWDASERSAATAEDIRTAQQRIASLVAGSYPKFSMQDGIHAQIAFEGAPGRLRVLAPDPEIPGEMAYATVRLATMGGATALVLEREPELAPADAPKPAAEVLLKGVRSLVFSYFGTAEADAEPHWSNAWQEKTRPPQLVRIRAELADHRVAWPALTVSPQIDGDVSCTLDALTRYCGGR